MRFGDPTGRDPDRVSTAIGKSDGLLVAKLDVNEFSDAEQAAAVEHFGRIDVLVNNAASFFAAYLRN